MIFHDKRWPGSGWLKSILKYSGGFGNKKFNRDVEILNTETAFQQ